MTETKHTPGPWSVLKWSKRMSIEGNIHQVTNRENYPAAFVPAWDAPEDGQVDGTDEAIANARLIAAAPELLEALEWYRNNMCEGFCVDLKTEVYYSESMDFHCAGCKARAAIAKAKGQDT